MLMLAHVGPLSGAVTKPWIWIVARPIRIKWSPETVGKFLSVDPLQSLVHCLYYRTDESVEFGERLDWPALWPNGTYVDIALSLDAPQLEPRLSLRSKLKTPQPVATVDNLVAFSEWRTLRFRCLFVKTFLGCCSLCVEDAAVPGYLHRTFCCTDLRRNRGTESLILRRNHGIFMARF
jgi:hypothetical protein